MPGFLLTADTEVLCPHGGRGAGGVPNARVRAGGVPLLEFGGPPAAIGGCQAAAATAPAPLLGGTAVRYRLRVGPALACLQAMLLTPAQRVRSLGRPVLLHDTAVGLTPSGASGRILPRQMRVKGI